MARYRKRTAVAKRSSARKRARKSTYSSMSRKGVSGRHSGYSSRRKTTTTFKRSFNKAITNKIQNLISKNNPTGTYTKTYSGNVSTVTSNQYSFWDQVNRTAGVLVGGEFLAFDTRKILDAVSILFNSKVAIMNSFGTTLNLDDKTTKFKLQYASWEVEFKNMSDISLELEVWEIEHKRQDASTFLSSYPLALANVNQVGGTTSLIAKIGVNPGQVPQLALNYNIKKVKKTLKPGYTCKHFVKISNVDIDFNKYWDREISQVFQKFSKEIVVRVHPSVNVSSTGIAAEAAYWTGNTTSLDHLVSCIVKEKYVCDAPDDVDFSNEQDSTAWFTDFPAALDTPNIRTVENINLYEQSSAQLQP